MHDVVTNARHRWPSARFEVREGPVQGAQAVSTMIRSLPRSTPRKTST